MNIVDPSNELDGLASDGAGHTPPGPVAPHVDPAFGAIDAEAAGNEAAGSPIYGGEQQVSGGPRHLVVVQPLADRSAMSHKARIVILEADIREAMALAARRLNDAAMKYSVTGYEWNLDDIVFEHGGHRVLTATLRIARPGQ